MPLINKETLQTLVEKVRKQILTSHDIVDRTDYPYYHNHPSVPEALALYKSIMSQYRARCAEYVSELGTVKINPHFSINYNIQSNLFPFHGIFLTSQVMASLGIGECQDCVNKLAAEVVLVGHGDLYFLNFSLINSNPGMETGHCLLVVNVKAQPPAGLNMSLEELLSKLPEEAIVADPFLGLVFSPKEVPQKLQDYIKVYGGKTKIASGSMHFFNFSKTVLMHNYLTPALNVLKKMKTQSYSLAEKTSLEKDTAILALLNDKHGLNFTGYRDQDFYVEAVSVAETKEQKKSAILLASRLRLSYQPNLFSYNEKGSTLYVVSKINSESTPSVIQTKLGKK